MSIIKNLLRIVIETIVRFVINEVLCYARDRYMNGRAVHVIGFA